MELALELAANPSKEAEIKSKQAAIVAKVEKMSAANQLVYAGEVIRLTAENSDGLINSVFEGSELQGAIKELGEELNKPETRESLQAFTEALGATASGGSPSSSYGESNLGEEIKTLAKEYVDLSLELAANPSREDEIKSKQAEIEAKVENMSAANQLVYAGEVIRLTAENSGELIKSALEGSEMQDALRDLGEALQELQDIQGLFRQ